jgi:hypothetical protein
MGDAEGDADEDAEGDADGDVLIIAVTSQDTVPPLRLRRGGQGGEARGNVTLFRCETPPPLSACGVETLHATSRQGGGGGRTACNVSAGGGEDGMQRLYRGGGGRHATSLQGGEARAGTQALPRTSQK